MLSAPSVTFADGQIVADRFLIVRFVASGGMGELYEAEDRELHEHVALKTIRPEIAQDASAIARFKREAFLARQVTHPNICRIFDLFRHQPAGSAPPVTFVTMEFLAGETLADRLRAGTDDDERGAVHRLADGGRPGRGSPGGRRPPRLQEQQRHARPSVRRDDAGGRHRLRAGGAARGWIERRPRDTGIPPLPARFSGPRTTWRPSRSKAAS